MNSWIFVFINFIILAIIYYIDRKNIITHLGLGFTAFILIFFVEIVPVTLGFWEYHIGPKIWKYAPHIFLLYFPFLSISYFFSNKLFRIEEKPAKRQKNGS